MAEITKVIMKDGRVLYGRLWQWHPEEGYMTLSTLGGYYGTTPDKKIYFDDIESAFALIQHIPLIENRGKMNLLIKAKEDGWKE